ELQAGFAGRVRQSLHAAVVKVSTTVENHFGHIGGLGPFGDELADCRGTLGATAAGLALDIGIEAGSGSESASGRVVDDLGIDVLVGAVDAQTRTTIGARLDGLADALLAPFRSLEADGHLLALPYFFLPSLRAMYSPT